MFNAIKNKIEDHTRKKNDKEVLDKDIVDFLEKKYGGDLEKYDTVRDELITYFDRLELRPELLQGKTALDVGSAAHFFDEYCKEKYGTNFMALDRWDSCLGTKHDMGVLADARALPFKNESFDLIISNASMPHILVDFREEMKETGGLSQESKEKITQDLLIFFREVYNVIKQGGQIRLSTFCEKGDEMKELLEDKRMAIVHRYQLLRIKVIQEALEIFEKESGARCIFKDEEKGGLIIIRK